MMAMARVLSQHHKRTFYLHHFCRSFSRQARASKGAEPIKKRKPGVLGMAERCKSVLGLNWRGQLTTLKPRLADKEEREKSEKTIGELSNYIILHEKPVIWLPENSQHCPNLLLDNRASFIVGHTDPSPLMKAFQQTQKHPPHIILVGTLMVPDDGDGLSAAFMKLAIKKQLSELQQAVDQTSLSIRGILESGRHVLRIRVQALNSMLESKGDDTYYRFDASSCHYVDSSGNKHLINPEASIQASNPPSQLLPVVIEGINRNYTRRKGLKLLCACFLHVQVQDAFMFSADRWGFNVIAKVPVDPKAPNDAAKRVGSDGKRTNASGTLEWRDLRLTFKHEVTDLNEFCGMLGQMERESVVALDHVRKAYKSDQTVQEVVEA